MTEEEVRRVAEYAIDMFITNHFEFGLSLPMAKGITVNSTIHEFVPGHEWPEPDWDRLEREQSEREEGEDA